MCRTTRTAKPQGRGVHIYEAGYSQDTSCSVEDIEDSSTVVLEDDNRDAPTPAEGADRSEKPDSTSDLVVHVTQRAPAESPLVTSSQSVASSPAPTADAVAESADAAILNDAILNDAILTDAISNDAILNDAILNDAELYSVGAAVADVDPTGEAAGDTAASKAGGSVFATETGDDTEIPSEINNDGAGEFTSDKDNFGSDENSETSETVSEPDAAVEDRCFQAYVSVQNWGPYLETSKSYCAECEILFATENAIAAHNMVEHSFLTEKEASTETKVFRLGSHQENSLYECPKCPAKYTRGHNLIRHMDKSHKKVDVRVKEEPITTPEKVHPNLMEPADTLFNKDVAASDNSVQTYLCQICKARFTNNEDLIVHLYKHATGEMIAKVQEHRCDFCTATFTQKQFLERHLWSHARSRHSSGAGGAVASIRDLSRASARSSESLSSSGVEGATVATSRALGSEAAAQPDATSTSKTKNEMFMCPICFQYFNRAFIYLQHMIKIHHQHEETVPDRARVTAVSTVCRRCREKFRAVVDYNLHIRQHHTEYTCRNCSSSFIGCLKFSSHSKVRCKGNKSIESVPGAEETDSQFKVHFDYKCILCHASFSDFAAGQHHRRVRHPGIGGSVIIRNTQKIIIKKKSPPAGISDSPVDAKKAIISRVTSAPIAAFDSKSSAAKINISKRKLRLVRCDRCKHHMSEKGISKHLSRGMDCVKMKYRVCYCCGLSFTETGMKTHMMLHKFSSKPLYARDFNIENPAGERIDLDLQTLLSRLPRCRRCGAIYGRRNACKRNCKDVKTIKCKICDAKFTSGAYAWHTVLHKQSDASQAPSEDTNERVKQKTKPTFHETRQKGINLQMVRCDKCKMHVYAARGGPESHRQIDCTVVKPKICLICGLTLTNSSFEVHKVAHSKSTVPLTMASFNILRISDMRPVGRELCPFPACWNCGVRCVDSGGHKSSVECKMDDTIECNVCRLTFTQVAYPLHVGYFGCDDPAKGETDGVDAVGNTSKVKLEKQLDVLGIKVIRCDVCKNHINNAPGRILEHKKLGPACKKLKYVICKYCGLAFTAATISTHLVHHRLSSVPLTARDFVVVTFSDEPVQYDLQALLSRVPRCKRCGVLFNYDSKVCTEERCRDVEKIECGICDRVFSIETTSWHRSLHENSEPSVERKQQSGTEMARILDKYRQVSSVESWTQLYRCTECDAIVDSYDEVAKHCELHRAGGSKRTVRSCDVCELNFEEATFARHKEIHASRPGLDRSSFEVSDYRAGVYGTKNWLVYKYSFTGDRLSYELVQPGAEQHTLYRCVRCEKYCAGRVAAYRHSMRDENCLQPATRCSYCDLAFAGNLDAHRATHAEHPHLTSESFRVFCFQRADAEVKASGSTALKRKFESSETKAKPSSEVTEGRPKLYRCRKCATHFMSANVARNHSANVDHSKHLHKTRRKICRSCNLKFTDITYEKHFAIHHEKNNYKRADFIIVNIDDEVGGERPSSPELDAAKRAHIRRVYAKEMKASKPKLYRCPDCSLHYLNEKQAKKHWFRHVTARSWRERLRRTCALCGYAFTSLMLDYHHMLHHESNSWQRADFVIETLPGFTRRYNTSHRTQNKNRIVLGTSVQKVKPTALKIRLKPKSPAEYQTSQPEGAMKKYLTKAKVKSAPYTVYKCTPCGVCYVSHSTLYSHVSVGHQKILPASIAKCGLCGLLFSKVSLKKHKATHHSGGEVGSYRVVEMNPKSHELETNRERVAKYRELMAAYEKRGGAGGTPDSDVAAEGNTRGEGGSECADSS